MSRVQQVTEAMEQRQISLQPWTNKTTAELGIIFIAGTEQFENLVSLLNIQLKQKGNRIIVLNTSADPLSRQEVMRIFSFGAEYYFEFAACDTAFECLSNKLIRWRTIETMMRSPLVRNHIAGESRILKQLIRDALEVAAYSDSAVLILGERGTGKESMARLIHAADKQRSQANLVLVDCTTIRTELSGSEFFGHEKGSYTGAEHSREGAFALADNGCLFLDEVGEMPLRMQAELLRVIQEGVYKKLGSNAWRQTDFRLISATNRQLEEESEKGAFRKDLYDRISLWKCNMPSLHQRREDIPALVQFFLRKRFPEEEIPVIDPAVLDYLKERDYYGNIRELQHLVHRITMRYVGKGPITLGDIPEMDRQFFIPVKKSWHEHPELAGAIAEALQNGYDVKSIMDTIKSLITRTALSFSDSNKEVSQLLGKSERWIQLQKARER
jgi:transcriptional regulator with GAF, ATPase, and Fis domain